MDGSEKASTRDFMMCLPSADLRSFRTTMMRYPNAMVFSRTLMTELLSQRKNQFGNYETLMEAASSSFWSEHSERATIVSWAASCEVDRETRVPLGLRGLCHLDESAAVQRPAEDGVLAQRAVRGQGRRSRR